MKIYDPSGNIFEFHEQTGLISMNGAIVSGADYEPLFLVFPDDSNTPIPTGILFKKTGQVLGKSGRLSDPINLSQL